MSKITRKIFALHSWLGLLTGCFILVFFFTGAIIVFRVELNNWELPHLFNVKPTGEPLSYQRLYDRIKAQRPDLYLYSFRYVPQKPGETIEMRVYDPQRKDYPLLYANPYTGEVLGISRNSVYDVLIKLHHTFFLGKVGELLAACFALALLGSVITGTIVYRKHFLKSLLFMTPIKFKNWRTTASGLHHVLGAWALAFNIVLAFSGCYMLKYAFDIHTHFSSSDQPLQTPPVIQVNLDSLIHSSLQTLDGRFNYMDFPRSDGDAIKVFTTSKNWLMGEFTNYVAFDPAKGIQREIFREQDLAVGEQFEYALYTLHYGQYGGKTIKILYAFFGLASAVVTITGFMLWYRRKGKGSRIESFSNLSGRLPAYKSSERGN